MDFDSIGDRLKDIQISKKSIEEVPKILSPELRDVFHVFANMLDIKSFMKLAMSSKDTYKRCMEDKEIRISVDVKSISVYRDHDVVRLDFFCCNVLAAKCDNYVAALQKLPCKIKLDELDIWHYHQARSSLVPQLSNIQRYLKEIGVDKIYEIIIHGEHLETFVAIVEDFDVKSVKFTEVIETHILRSFLQLNLEKFTAYQPISVDFLLEIDSPIGEVSFPNVIHLSKEELMNIMANVQSGYLRRLTVASYAVNWDDYDKLTFDYQGELPEDRPLLLERAPDSSPLREYWFLHWNGVITKCVKFIGIREPDFLQIFKCEPWEYPWILRKEEDILKALAERRPRVSCSENQFHKFSTNIAIIDSSHEGPLPENRPLYCKNSESHLIMLDKYENLMECTWEDGNATWESFNPREDSDIKQPAFAKNVFWKVVNQVKEGDQVKVFCSGIEMFDSWSEDLKKLDFEFSGDIPSERPLIFERSPSEREDDLLRLVLLKDRLIECHYFPECFGRLPFVRIGICSCWNRPQLLFSQNNLLETLSCDYKVFLHDMYRHRNNEPAMTLQERLVVENSNAGFWYMLDEVEVRRIVWEKGRLSVTDGKDLRDAPPTFMKQVFRNFAEQPLKCKSAFKMELVQFWICLQQFTVVSFDYSGPLTSESPMVFAKNEIRHTCRRGCMCQCSDVCIRVFLLWNGTRLTECSWGMEGPENVRFRAFSGCEDMPPALKSQEFLKTLQLAKYDKSSHSQWFERLHDIYT